MKIFETEDDGKIGDLLYKTVEFTRLELIEGGVGVISQGAVQRYFAKKNPDLAIKKFGSFKLDSQADTVTARFAVVNKVVDQKLLNPGYDELKEQYDAVLLDYKNRSEETVELQERYDALVIAVGKEAQKFSDLLVENEELKNQLNVFLDEDPIAGDDAPDPGPEDEPELVDGEPGSD